MPILKIHTNLGISEDQKGSLLEAMTNLVVREMNKPKQYVQVWLESNCDLLFAGTDQPSAFVELRALDLAEAKAKPLSAAITGLLKEKLSIPGDRIFINFLDVPRAMWGWDGSTFG